MINNAGLAATARHLGIRLSTLKYWMLKFDIRLEWIAVRSNERIVSKRAAGAPRYGIASIRAIS